MDRSCCNVQLGCTPLMDAAANGSITTVHALIVAGAKLNVKHKVRQVTLLQKNACLLR
jgi:ankyrin repeat protein